MSARPEFRPNDDQPIFVISVAASLAGMHAQTLRQYDRLGLVRPSRTRGGGRRYSGRDVALLREVQRLSQDEGISLAGIQRILQLEDQVRALQARVRELQDQLDEARAAAGQFSPRTRIFAVGPSGDVTPLRPGQQPPRDSSGALVLWRPRR